MKRLAYGASAFVLALACSASLSFAATMQCAPFQQITTTFPTGATYTADADGILTAVAANDVLAVTQSGCQLVGVSGYTLIGRIVGANMAITTDQVATMFIATNAYYVPAEMILKNCSVSLTTAQGAVYDTASKGGVRQFGSGTTQAFTACTGVGTAVSFAAQAAGIAVVEPQTAPPILSLTTGQGAAATANILFYGYVTGK